MIYMKISRSKISNTVFVILIFLMLYTPTKVYLIRWLSFSPSIIEEENKQVLTDYQWRLKDIHANYLPLASLGDKPLFISFWATWCAPCVAELPSIQKLYNDYQKDVNFVLISQEDFGTITTFLNQNNLDLPIYNRVGKLPHIFEVSSIPTSFIIGSDGKVHVNKSGAADWNSKSVRDLLDDLLSKNN